MFEGKTIGRKIARYWNMGLKTLHAPCPVCKVDCANQPDLDRHVANRHKREKSDE
jgi:hypothetical protein